MSDLAKAAYTLADEIRDGKWNYVRGIHSEPVTRCPEIIDELRRRAPGYSLEEYQKAIARGMFESR